MNFSKPLLTFLYLGSFIAYAQNSNWEWAVSAGGPATDFANDIATDVSGNVYMTGALGSGATIGTTVLNSSGNKDFVLVKYDPDGNVLWAVNAGSGLNDEGKSVTVDHSGNVYVTGYFDGGQFSIGGIVLQNIASGSGDMFIAKYDPNGNVLWAKSAGGTSFDEFTDCAIDPQDMNSIYVTGKFSSSSIVLDGDTIVNPGNTNFVLVKYDSDGTLIWVRDGYGQGQAGVGCAAHSIAISAASAIYIAGSHSNTLTFGTDVLSITGGGANLFIAKFDTAGNAIWGKQPVASGANAQVNSIVTDLSGGAYIAGCFLGSDLIFGTDTLGITNPSYADVFLARYDGNGTNLWARKGASQVTDIARSVTVSANGYVYVSGYFYGTDFTMGTTTLTGTNTGDSRYFLLQCNPSGDVVWGEQNANSSMVALVSGGYETIYAAGLFGPASISFSGNTVTGSGGLDLFVAKLHTSALGVQSIPAEKKLSAYPNPSPDGFFTLESVGETILSADIYDASGRKVNTVFVGNQLDLSHCSSGLYRLIVQTAQTVCHLQLCID